jgi:hypothetical protein
MKSIACLFILNFLLLTSCKNSTKNKWSEFPEVINISKLQQTQFAPTLESPIDRNKNVVYAPALLYAWDEVRQKLDGSIKLADSNSREFKLFNQSTSYKNSLTKDEYSAEAEIISNEIIARAFFNKTLPFPAKLQKIDDGLVFNKAKVAAFGMQSFDEEAVKFTQILYYKEDDHFVLRLIPKDVQHEILLVKGIGNVTTLSEAVKKTNEIIGVGMREKSDPKISWKYSLNEIDIFSIPAIKFNIENDYRDIEGQVFKTDKGNYFVETAYQRTGFILNENGAIAESHALIATTDSAETEPIKIEPKRMIFNKPFFVIVKRRESKNPYFVMYVQNNELLTKQ